MKVVFFEDVEGTAQVGDVKDVRNGFARNFLLPRGLAGSTTKDNLWRAQGLSQKETRRQARLDADAQLIVDKITANPVRVEAKVGESGRLFGSVTNRDIAEKLNAATGLSIDAHTILLPEPIRELGTRAVTVKLSRNVSAEVSVEVVPDSESKANVRAAAEAIVPTESANASDDEGYEPADPDEDEE